MLATTRVPGRVLGWRDFLEVGKLDEEPSACPLFETLRGPRGTGRGIYSSYTSTTPEETPGNTVVIGNLLVTEAPARFSPVFTMVGRASREIGSTKLRPNSYEKNKTTRQGKLSKNGYNKRNTESTRKKRKLLTAGGGLLAENSETVSGTTLAPFSIFWRSSRTSSSVNSRVGTIREGSSAPKYSKPKFSRSFRG